MSVHNPAWLASECRHHWLIDSPNGPASDARCKRCGVRRSFRNHYNGEQQLLSKAERAVVTRTKHEESVLTKMIAQLGGGRIAVRPDKPYEPPIEYGSDGSAR